MVSQTFLWRANALQATTTLCVALLPLLLPSTKAMLPQPGVLPSDDSSVLRRIDGMEHGLWQMSQQQVLKTLQQKARSRVRPPPDILSVEPPWISTEGGANLTITGDFLGVRPRDLLGIQVAGMPCWHVKWVASSEVLCTAPNSSVEGVANLSVSTRSGGVAVIHKALRYEAPLLPPVDAGDENKAAPPPQQPQPQQPQPQQMLPQRPHVSGASTDSLNVSWAPFPDALFYKLLMDADNYTLAVNTWRADSGTIWAVVDGLASDSTYRFKVETTIANKGRWKRLRSPPSEAHSTLATDKADLFVSCMAERSFVGQSDLSYNRAQLMAPRKSGRLLSLLLPLCVQYAGPSGVSVEISLFEMHSIEAIATWHRTLYEQPVSEGGSNSRCPTATEQITLRPEHPPLLRAGHKYLIALRQSAQGTRDKCVQRGGQLVAQPLQFCEGQQPMSKCEEYPMVAARRCYVKSRLFWLSNFEHRGGSFSSRDWPPSSSENQHGWCNAFSAMMRREKVVQSLVVEEAVAAATAATAVQAAVTTNSAEA